MKNISKSLEQLDQLIAEKEAERIVSVDADVFKHKLLPLALARYSNVDYDIDLRNWQATVGTPPTIGVRVTKNGEELFVTPPLILSPEVSFENTSLLNILKDAERAEAHNMPVGDMLADPNIKSKVGTRNISIHLPRWILIFKYFGVVLVPLGSTDDSLSAPDTKEEDVVISPPNKSNVWDDDDDGFEI